MKLRDYQEAARDALLQGESEFRKQVCVMPTGSGKTVTFASIIDRKLPGKTLVLAHRESLVEQAADKIWDTIKIEPGIEMAKQKADSRNAVVVGSVQSMINRLDRYAPDHFDSVIIDECHHAIADSWQSVLNHFDDHASVFGFTATPNREGRVQIGSYFDNFTYEIGMRELIDKGHLAPIVLKALPVNIDMRNVSSVAGDFHVGQTHQTLVPYLQEIARNIKEHAAGRKTLVFLPLVETSRLFADICKDEGLNANWVSGSRHDRENVLKQFKKCDEGVLANALLLTEGFDQPSIDCVAVLRPSRSTSFVQQCVGRGTRLHPGKKNLLLLDFLWHHEQHSLVRPANVFTDNDAVADIMTRRSTEAVESELDMDVLERDAVAERHASLEAAIAANRRRAAKTIDPVALSLAFNNLGAAEYQPTVDWHRQPVTDKQKVLLKRQNIDVESVRDKGHAAKLIGMIMPRYNQKLATPKQVMFLRRHNYPNPEKATFSQASAFIGRKVGR